MIDHCDINNGLDVVFVIDRSTLLSQSDGVVMNVFLYDIVGLLLHPDYTRISIVSYGGGGAQMLIKLQVSESMSRDEIISKVKEIDYTDNSMVDDEHYCRLGIEMGIQEMLDDGNAENNVDNVIIVIQNGPCGDGDKTCQSDLVEDVQNNGNIRAYVLNFGSDAVEEQNSCVASSDGFEAYSGDGSMIVLFLQHFPHWICRICMYL